MAVKISYDDQTPGVLIEYSGIVGAAEAIGVTRTVFSDPRFPTLKYWISDRTATDKFDIDAGDAERIASLTREAARTNSHLVMAQVSPNDIDFGMSRMYEMLAGEEGFRTMVVRTRAEAERWVEEQLQTHLTR